MKGQRNLLVGFDLGEEFSQISCFNMNTFEPESIKFDYDSDNELIPTVLAIKANTSEIIFADEAVSEAQNGNATLIDNILESVRNEEIIEVNDTKYDAVDMLSDFFRKSLSLIKRYHPNDTIARLVVTVERTDMTLVRGIFAALSKLDINKDRASVQGYAQSYMYYALSQKKELWMNDVALFHFDSKGLQYYQINMDRRHRPITVGVWQKDYSDTFNIGLIQKMNSSEVREIFENLVKGIFHKQIITTVYLTGKGFNGKWVEQAVKGFCQGKRIFIGQRLFSEGACYAAREVTEHAKLDGYLLMSEDMIGASVSVNVYCEAKEQELIFVKGTTTWYEAEKTYDFILNNSNEIEIMIRNDLAGTKKSFLLSIDLMNARPNKTTRVRMKVKFLDVQTCVVTVRDLGFGDFYPATNRVWEKIIQI